MDSRATPSGASAATPPTLADLNPHATTFGHAGDSMGADFSLQLLTPENSRSETSSNTENTLNDEKPTSRRRSTRVTRASLQKATHLGHSETDNDNEGTSSLGSGNYNAAGETPVGAAGGRKSKSSLVRHSLAVMESSQWGDTTPIGDDTSFEDPPMAPATPISNSSQEPHASDMNTATQQRTLRKRVSSALVEKENRVEKKASTRKSVNTTEPVRRSARLSLPGRTSYLVDRAGSVLGKRSRDVIGMGKEVGRRASLRPRNVIRPPEEPAAAAPRNVPTKRRRVSDSDIPDSKAKEFAGEAIKPLRRYKPKRWLSHGLYIGQEPTDSPPRQNRGRTTKRRRGDNHQRKLLPMPMFCGARLLVNGRDFKLPFDVFSPLPPGQPKPDEWRKTNKNVFVGEAGSIWRANKPLELSKCLCTKDTGCDENCQNRYMFYECDDGNCGLGSECGNRNFEGLKQRTKAGGKYNIGVEVIKTPDRGYGVRSNRTFEPNQIIVEYTGEIITQTECERRMRTIYKNDKCYYLMYFDQNMIIDATRGSIARFVNHSCEPNCRMEKWTVAGKPRMALFAGDRGIMTGEELSYDYNFDPYSQKNVQECRCGSENCRGVLGPRPKEQRVKDPKSDDPSPKRTTARTAGAKRKRTPDDPPSRRRKRRRVLGSRSINTGVKSPATKARSGVSRSTTIRRRGTGRRGTPREETTTARRGRGTVGRGATREETATSRRGRGTARRGTARGGTARGGAARGGTARRGTAGKGAARDETTTPRRGRGTARRGTTRRSTARDETTTSRTITARTEKATQARDNAKTKHATKSPVVKRTKVKVTATARANNSPGSRKTQSRTPSSTLSHPSADRKARILAKGTTTRRQLTKEKRTKQPRGRPKKNTQSTRGARGARNSTAGRASTSKN